MSGIPASVRFTPSRVEGLPAVSEVTISPNRMELVSDGGLVIVRFADIARWPRPRWFYRLAKRLGRRRWLPVADRDWFHAPPDRFFRFYTNPPIVVCMPADEPNDRGPSYFMRIQVVMGVGGFHTFDLG